MSGFLRRIRGARPAAHDRAPEHGAAWSSEGGSPYAHDEATGTGGAPALPAGVDLDALVGDRPDTTRRGRLRRRLRHLRGVREVLLRDLGGLVFEMHRGGLVVDPSGSAPVAGKLDRLHRVTAELHELEHVLGDRRGLVVREPGIGGTCPTCGELHGSDARFCWACGTPLVPGAARPIVARHGGALPAVGAGQPPPQPWGASAAPAAAPAAPVTPPATVQPHIDGSGEELHADVPAEEPPTVVQPAPHPEPAPSPHDANGIPADDEARTRVLDASEPPRRDAQAPGMQAGDPLRER